MRCKACDAMLEESDIIWQPSLHKHEDLCTVCRRKALYESDDLEELDTVLKSLLNIGDV